MNAAGLAAMERSAAMAVDCVWEAAVLAGMGWWDAAADRLTEAAVRVSAARHAFEDGHA